MWGPHTGLTRANSYQFGETFSGSHLSHMVWHCCIGANFALSRFFPCPILYHLPPPSIARSSAFVAGDFFLFIRVFLAAQNSARLYEHILLQTRDSREFSLNSFVTHLLVFRFSSGFFATMWWFLTKNHAYRFGNIATDSLPVFTRTAIELLPAFTKPTYFYRRRNMSRLLTQTSSETVERHHRRDSNTRCLLKTRCSENN